MPTVAPTDRARAARARPARPSRPARRRSDVRTRPDVEADRRRVQEICVAVFVVALLLSVVATLALRDAPGVLPFVPSFVAAYVACSAWLGAAIVQMRRPVGPVPRFWAVAGALALIACFALQVVVARGGLG